MCLHPSTQGVQLCLCGLSEKTHSVYGKMDRFSTPFATLKTAIKKSQLRDIECILQHIVAKL